MSLLSSKILKKLFLVEKITENYSHKLLTLNAIA